ncbi:MAG: permease-like cell division protein FtsX [Merdibacter sp.]
MDNVAAATLSTKDEELELMIKEKGEAFAMYRGEENPLNNAFFITVVDADQIAQTCEAITQLDFVSDAVYGGTSVSSLIRLLDMVRQGGIIFVILLFLLTAYLISSTIKTTIYARSKEIAIMRNVGASNHFIKVPFMIEGVLIGLVGAIIPCILTVVGYAWFYDKIGGRLFTDLFALQPVRPFTLFMCRRLIAAGGVIGMLGSFLSTTRYLHWKR